MATFIHANGNESKIEPLNKKDGFCLREMYTMLHCTTVQAIALSDGRTMWMDEEGKLGEVHVVNEKATKLLHDAGGMPDDYVVGNVLITSKGEVL